jgi:hypothetical protein
MQTPNALLLKEKRELVQYKFCGKFYRYYDIMNFVERVT